MVAWFASKIVETEAYDQTDASSHGYRGETERTKVMFGEYGHLYVYFTYGMHYCANIVTGEKGYGAGVLIRAVEPVDGVDIVEKKRNKAGSEATNGPAQTLSGAWYRQDAERSWSQERRIASDSSACAANIYDYANNAYRYIRGKGRPLAILHYR